MKAAIYSRKSKYTANGESTESQIEMCKQYAITHFGENCIFKIYEDEGFSAKNTDRPQFQKMMADILSDRFDCLICYRLDRISRNVSDFSSILDILQDNNISFISIRESFDTSTPMGRAMIYISSVFAQLERETIAQRIKDNKYHLAYLGRWQGGIAPTGFKAIKQHYTDSGGRQKTYYVLSEDPHTSSIIRTIFIEYLNLQSLSALSDFLDKSTNIQNIPISHSKAVLCQILRNPVYATNTPQTYQYLLSKHIDIATPFEMFNSSCGLTAYGKTGMSQNSAKRKRRSVQNWTISIGSHLPIIDADIWLETQHILDSNRRGKTIIADS